MQLFHIPQFTIQNWNGHIYVLNGALWDVGQVHCRIYEIGQLINIVTVIKFWLI